MIMAYEDFGDFTEVDPDGELSVTSNKINLLDQNFDGDSRVYKDYTVDFFSGDFTHKFEFKMTMLTGGNDNTGLWALSNASGGLASFAGDDVLSRASIWMGIDYKIRLNTHNFSKWVWSAVLSLNVKYYITVNRSGTVYTMTIRTGSHEGTVIDTIAIDPGSAKDFRYLYVQFES